jgi:hypothetical protein
MPDVSYKWVLCLGLLGMLADTFISHPTLAVDRELPYVASVPPNPNVPGFASERQWLFAHRYFRNRCVLEALAESERLGEKVGVASQEFRKGLAIDGIGLDLRLASND